MNPSQHAEQFQSQLANYVPQFIPPILAGVVDHCRTIAGWDGWCWGYMPCFVLVA